MPQKTNAARFLDPMGISYELREYEVDPDDLAAEAVATKIGLPPEQLFKTLVARGDRHGICMVIIPANTELDLKALAAAFGDRKIHLVPMTDAVRKLQRFQDAAEPASQPASTPADRREFVNRQPSRF